MALPKKRQPQRPEAPPTGVLDWTDGHWSGKDRQCRYCPALTPLRDSKGKPAHKVCAEEAIAKQIAEDAAKYENERFMQ